VGGIQVPSVRDSHVFGMVLQRDRQQILRRMTSQVIQLHQTLLALVVEAVVFGKFAM
jgi:hypothetical protein